MALPLFLVDAFATDPFAGNPAAVCLLDEERDATWMHAVARETNQPMTAFVSPRADGDFGLRWFEAGGEHELCGHATLATAHLLHTLGRASAERPLRFHTKGGVLLAAREGDAIALDFPSLPAAPRPFPGLAEALGTDVTWTGQSVRFVLAELATEAAVRALVPDFAALARVGASRLVVTARGGGEHDFVSRCLAPGFEDPVTGSAHCVLAPYWSAKLGKRAMTGYQASSRGGVVGVRDEGTRTILLGRAVTVARGELLA